MRKLLFLALAVIPCLAFAQTLKWQTCIGGTDDEEAASLQKTTDDGFIIAGWTESTGISGHNGGKDYYIIKLDSNGNTGWEKCFGTSDEEQAFSIRQTPSGGYITTGIRNVWRTWTLRLNSAGDTIWTKYYSTLSAGSRDIECTSDSGYTIAGYKNNNFNDSWWIQKLNTDGDSIWSKSMGGSNTDIARGIQQTSDGGYIACGTASSADGDVTGHHGSMDAWVVKLDSAGNITWSNSLGGSSADEANSVIQTKDGGYVMAGETSSNDGDVWGNKGTKNYWIVRLNSSGDTIWTRCYGGTLSDAAEAIQQTQDGGFVVAGWANSTDGDVTGSHGSIDCWIIRLDANGDLIWSKCMGGSLIDRAFDIQLCDKGDYVIAGDTKSDDGDVSGLHGNYPDIWVARFTMEPKITV